MPLNIKGYNLANSAGLSFGTSGTKIVNTTYVPRDPYLPGMLGSCTDGSGAYKCYPFPVNDVNVNVNNVWSTSSFAFTCPVAGIYYTSYSGICGNGSATSYNGYYGLIVNGGLWYFSYRDTNNTWDLHHVEMMVKLSAGDTIAWAMNIAPAPDASTTAGSYRANHNTCTIWLVG